MHAPSQHRIHGCNWPASAALVAIASALPAPVAVALQTPLFAPSQQHRDGSELFLPKLEQSFDALCPWTFQFP
eukprot:12933326-Prorocentrum_lima.AAC.1